MTDIRNLEDIKVFVNCFYDKVRQDATLAPLFARRIAEPDWQIHLDRMYDFWNTVLFFQNAYKGNPFSKHVGLPALPAHFDRWIELFKTAIDENFEGASANDTKKRAETMAALFQSKLAYLEKNTSMVPLV